MDAAKVKKTVILTGFGLTILSMIYFSVQGYNNHQVPQVPVQFMLPKQYLSVRTPALPKRITPPLFSPLKKTQSPVKLAFPIYGTFTKTLLSYGVPENQIENIKKTARPISDLSKLPASHAIKMTLDTDKNANLNDIDDATHIVRNMSFYISPGVRLDIMGDGERYKAEKFYEKIYETPTLAAGKITVSLSSDAKRVGVPNNMVREVIKLFSLNVDFRQLQKNDSFEFGFNKFTNKNGEKFGLGKLNYASLTVNNKKHEIFYIIGSDGKGSWINEKGMNNKPLLMKTPIDGARLSSKFGRRRHPVLGYTKQHTGIDFAAPTGTPIYASGDGVIVKKYRSSSYGNYIKIRHNNTYDTAYAHMSRFAKFSEGQRVNQGDVIGYVGTTGRSTGPHLHYEVHNKSVPVNPHSSDIPTVSTVTSTMKRNLDTIKKRLVKLRAHQKIEIVHNSINEIKHKLL
ncbi:MAG: murein DD-endopeptidase MepM/ murein hydrolase activator NlpD [Alphaproteobacteria bacterium]|jgi:murein DD-endopeptidase MepM/ murein hydrolase activator NlpD